MKKIILLFLLTLFVWFYTFQDRFLERYLLLRVVDELVGEVSTHGISILKNKVNFFSYFTGQIGRFDKDDIEIYKLSALKLESRITEESSLDLIQRAKYRELINLGLTKYHDNDTKQDLYFLTACLKLELAKRLNDQQKNFCFNIAKNYQKDFLPKQATNFYLAALIEFISQGEDSFYFNKSNLNKYLPKTDKLKEQNNYFTKEELKLNNFNGKGLALADFNNDGFKDVVFANSYGRPYLLFNDRRGGFTKYSNTNLNSATQAYQVSVADYNNDGWLDIFFARPFHSYQLYQNIKGKDFIDVSHKLGKFDQEKNFYGTWHSSWLDIDNDGDLDVFISQWGEPVPFGEGVLAKSYSSSLLLENLGTAEEYN